MTQTRHFLRISPIPTNSARCTSAVRPEARLSLPTTKRTRNDCTGYQTPHRTSKTHSIAISSKAKHASIPTTSEQKQAFTINSTLNLAEAVASFLCWVVATHHECDSAQSMCLSNANARQMNSMQAYTRQKHPRTKSLFNAKRSPDSCGQSSSTASMSMCG